MRARFGGLRVAFGIVSVLGACTGCSSEGDDSGSVPHCTPGESAACACPDGRAGAQVCAADGTFGACVCGASDATVSDARGDEGNAADGAASDAPEADRVDASDASVLDTAPSDVDAGAEPSDANAPDTTVGDGSVADTSQDTDVPDTNVPDTNVPDTSIADAASDVSATDGGPAKGVRCSRYVGGAGRQLVAAIASDTQGNMAIAGQFTGSADFGGTTLTAIGSEYDGFVAMYDAGCNLLWARTFGGPSQFSTVDFDPSGNVILGGSSSGTVDFGGGVLVSAGDLDIVIAKLDATGAYVWGKDFGDGGYQRVDDIALDAAGEIVVAGTFTGALSFGGSALSGLASGSGSDVYLAKLDGGGNEVWSEGFYDPVTYDGGPHPHDHQTQGVAVDQSGNIMMSTMFTGNIDVGGGTLSGLASHSYGANVLARYAPNGTFAWSKLFTGDGSASVGAFDASGAFVAHASVVTTSYDFGNGNVLPPGDGLVRYMSDGSVGWSTSYSPSLLFSSGPAIGPSGSFTMYGYFNGQVTIGGRTFTGVGSGFNMFLAQLAPSGAPLRTTTYGPPIGSPINTSDFISSVTYAPDGDLVYTGSYVRTIVVEGTFFPNSDPTREDIFLVRMQH